MKHVLLCAVVVYVGAVWCHLNAEDNVAFIRGDTNGSGGNPNIADVSNIVNYLFFSMEDKPCLKASDANDDGKVDVADSTFLIKFLFNAGPPMTSPFPNCGLDKSRDSLTCLKFNYCDSSLNSRRTLSWDAPTENVDGSPLLGVPSFNIYIWTCIPIF